MLVSSSQHDLRKQTMESLVAVSIAGITVVVHEVREAACIGDAQEFEVRIEFIHTIRNWGS